MKDWEPTSFRAWKSLDEPLSFFGIKGRFMVVFLIIGGFAGMTSLALGNTFGRIVTLLFLAAALIADYMFILSCCLSASAWYVIGVLIGSSSGRDLSLVLWESCM